MCFSRVASPRQARLAAVQRCIITMRSLARVQVQTGNQHENSFIKPSLSSIAPFADVDTSGSGGSVATAAPASKKRRLKSGFNVFFSQYKIPADSGFRDKGGTLTVHKSKIVSSAWKVRSEGEERRRRMLRHARKALHLRTYTPFNRKDEGWHEERTA